MAESQTLLATQIVIERKRLKRELTLMPLFGMIFFTVCGGSFGSEAIVGWSGPGMALILLIATPLLFSIPNMLMVRELGSMMPVEGGYYHWVKQAFGPLAGFLTGWMNLVVSWVDVSIYPLLAVYYIQFFFPVFREGFQWGSVQVSGAVLSWLFAVALIWLIAVLQVRGARLTGLTTNWVFVIMLIPLLVMSGFGIANWIRSGVTVSLPLLPKGQTFLGAFSVGLFVAMWNYMGWELPTSAGDEIVNPKRTYPMAMVLVLVATVATYSIPMLAGLYGGAGDNGRYQLWGIEESEEAQGIGPVLSEYGMTDQQIKDANIDPSRANGWEFPDIAHAIGERFGGTGSQLAIFLGSIVTFSAILSMAGLFIGNSLGASRIPFAMAEDGMMPSWFVKVHPKFGTPWIAILIASVIFSILSLSTFAILVVVDVFLNMMALMLQFLALWKLRFSHPHIQRTRVPGGWFGLSMVTLAPFSIIILAIYSQVSEEGMKSIWMGMGAILIGVMVYMLNRKLVKPGIPDVDPWVSEGEEG